MVLESVAFSNAPLSNVTPFTYRDGETYLEQLKRLRQYIKDVSETLQTNIDTVSNNNSLAIINLTTQLNKTLTDFITKWNSSQEDGAIIFDPTTGFNSSLNLVMGNIYNNTRYYAYFADQLDAFEYSAAEWDAMEYTARHFDLNLAYSPTETQATDTVPSNVTPNV